MTHLTHIFPRLHKHQHHIWGRMGGGGRFATRWSQVCQVVSVLYNWHSLRLNAMCIPVNPAPRRLQEDCNFKASLGYVMKACPNEQTDTEPKVASPCWIPEFWVSPVSPMSESEHQQHIFLHSPEPEVTVLIPFLVLPCTSGHMGEGEWVEQGLSSLWTKFLMKCMGAVKNLDS